MGLVVVELEREIGVVGERVRPASEHVATARGAVVRTELLRSVPS